MLLFQSYDMVSGHGHPRPRSVFLVGSPGKKVGIFFFLRNLIQLPHLRIGKLQYTTFLLLGLATL